MKKIIFPLLIVSGITLFAACTKTKTKTCSYTGPKVAVPASELQDLKHYIDSSNITAIEDPRGFFYNITVTGDVNNKPSACDTVAVSYVGKLVDGSTFDAGNSATLVLPNLIEGWRLGVPLIGKGGAITLYLPPSLGYGNDTTVSAIGANSKLIFKVELIDFN